MEVYLDLRYKNDNMVDGWNIDSKADLLHDSSKALLKINNIDLNPLGTQNLNKRMQNEQMLR